MKDSLLSSAQKSKIVSAVKSKNYRVIISILEAVKTAHAGTAKTKDKRFVIKELASHIKQISTNEKSKLKNYFETGAAIFSLKVDVSKQIGISLLWRGYKHNKSKVKSLLLQAADHSNWEVRESAGGAFANILEDNDDFYTVLKKWSEHKSPNVRRAVVIGALGYRKEGKVKQAFRLLEPLMYDSALYVKKNLGPFVLGSYFGNAFPEETFKQLIRWVKIKDPHLRWNIAMTFNNSFGNRFPKEAAGYIRILSTDSSIVVQRAVKSTLNHLSKRNKNIKI